MHPHVYLLDNVSPLGDFWPTMLIIWQQIHVCIGKPMEVDIATISSHAIGFNGGGLT
jgi:hypothetical protein